MPDVFDTYRPENFHSVNPCLSVDQPEQLLHFLKNAFFAVEIHRSAVPDAGAFGNSVIRIGDSAIMLSQARSPFEAMKTALYFFVDDVDSMHQRALDHGAKEVFAPADMPYQDRQSGIMDPSGNYWWISKRLVAKNYQDGR